MTIKKITAENWLRRDGEQFAAIEHASLNDSYAYLMDGADWIANFTKPELSKKVPDDVRNLFEVARGALCYGYYYYPLYTLGFEQLFRVGEAAIKAKFAEIGGDGTKHRHLSHRIDFLKSQGVISVSDFSTWTTIRELRNHASHPQRQNILPPGFVTGTLNLVAEMINKLFDS